MAISRMQQPRQMYGLGSLVKSITKGVKKIVKSPVGKAAILGIGAFGLPTAAGQNIFGGLLSTSNPLRNIPGMFSNIPKSLGLGVDKGAKPTFGQMAKVFGIGSLGGAALEALTAAGVEDPSEVRDVEALKAYMRDGYMKLNPDATPMQVDRFIEGQTYEYKADGGRIGYADGMNDPSDLPRGLQIDTTTRNPIPENALQEEIESVVRIMMGPGSAGIGEPEDGTMKGYQFFREKYLPKKVTEIAENYGIEENEVLRMIRDEMMQYIDTPKSLEKPEMANGGRMGFAMGNPEENAVQASGIMDLPLNQNPAGITELDLRETGGFIPPVGVKEKADDIPAMLSNNEFVFTADAVRGMGNGDVNKGAQRMYDMMKKLENGGRV